MAPFTKECKMAKSQTTKKDAHCGNCDFVYSFRPIYYFNRVYGLMPFTIVYDANGTFNGCVIRPLDMLWFIATVMLNVAYVFTITGDTQHLQDPKTLSNILTGSDYFLEISSMVCSIILIAMDMLFRANLVKILKEINAFDEKVRWIEFVRWFWAENMCDKIECFSPEHRLHRLESILIIWKRIAGPGCAVLCSMCCVWFRSS